MDKTRFNFGTPYDYCFGHIIALPKLCPFMELNKVSPYFVARAL